jgi:Na+/H+ antiporter NhaD/arsenite permease-like protein
MMSAVLAAILVVAIVAQAIWARARVAIVLLAAAGAVVLVSAADLATPHQILARVPWDVLILLIALGVVSQAFADARAFERVAVFTARHGGVDPARVVIVFGVVMYVVSGLVNNLTALLLVLPVLLVLLRVTGTTTRHARWLIGVMLVACNLGGAATPIGDFPAILLLGAGAMEFLPYLARALPTTFAALLVVLGAVHFLVRPARDVVASPATRGLTIAIIEALHRRMRVRWRVFVPAAVVLVTMLVVWAAVPARICPPDLVAWIGVPLMLLALPRDAASLVRRSVDVDAALFLFALFVLVGCVQCTGLFALVAQAIVALPVSPAAQLVVFLVGAGVLTGLFSAGPSMAALLVVAQSLSERVPADAVYVGLALSVCAGSSLFLTAATSGPLAQSLVEGAAIDDQHGRRVRFGFADFLPTGLLAFTIIQATAIAWAVVRVSLR